MWSHVRGWLALGGVLTAALLTAACQRDADAAAAAAVRLLGGGLLGPRAGPVVALGDSYTAGALLPLDTLANPPGCLRSAKAYPVLVARALGAPLTDAACASAGVKDMTAAQPTYLGTNPAQLTALAPDDRLVLLTLSGDDMGFLNVLQECVKLSFTQPWGSPCAAYYTRAAPISSPPASRPRRRR